MNRPIWLRIVLQLGIAVLLWMAVSLVGLGIALLTTPIEQAAGRGGLGNTGLWAVVGLASTVPFVTGGIIAVLLTWLVVRRPWDALGSAGVVTVAYAVTLGVLFFPFGPTAAPPGTLYLPIVGAVIGTLLGVVPTACWLQRHARMLALTSDPDEV